MPKSVLIGFLLLINLFAIRNLVLLCRDMLYGGNSAELLFPHPIYPPLQIPSTSLTAAHEAVGRTGSDFAAIYFPALQTPKLEAGYDWATSFDPWHRPSRSAPFVILLCFVTLSRLSFGSAALLHMLGQLLLFYAIFYLAFHLLGVRDYFLISILLVNAYLFFTPVGLTMFERGQFSLYLAGCYTLLVVGAIKRKPTLFVAAALLGFVKWTSFPVLLVIIAAYVLDSRGLLELKLRARTTINFSAVIGALILLPILFVTGTREFLYGLTAQELAYVPDGLSLLQFAPRGLVKVLPLLLILVGYINIRSCKGEFLRLVPYVLGVATIMTLYPTLAYDYNVPTLFGFIPIMIFWTKQRGQNQNTLRIALLHAFFLFMLVVSFSTQVTQSVAALVAVYLVFSTVLIISPTFVAKYDFRRATLAFDS